MIKFSILALVAVITGIAWLRKQWAMGKNKRTAGKLIDGLKNGTLGIESFEQSLDMGIRTKSLPGGEIPHFMRRLAGLANIRPDQRFLIRFAKGDGLKGIVIAEAITHDTFSVASNQTTEITYPCWLLLVADPSAQTIEFRSNMPDGNDHHQLLMDLCELIFSRCIVEDASADAALQPIHDMK